MSLRQPDLGTVADAGKRPSEAAVHVREKHGLKFWTFTAPPLPSAALQKVRPASIPLLDLPIGSRAHTLIRL